MEDEYDFCPACVNDYFESGKELGDELDYKGKFTLCTNHKNRNIFEEVSKMKNNPVPKGAYEY